MKQTRKSGWYLVVGLVSGLALIAISCGGTPAEEQSPAEQEQPAIEEPTIEEPVVDEPVVDEPVVDEPVVDEPVADEPAAEETGATGVSPIPHGLAGQEDCLQCHGEAGFKPFPADHTGRANDSCQGCHQPQN